MEDEARREKEDEEWERGERERREKDEREREKNRKRREKKKKGNKNKGQGKGGDLDANGGDQRPGLKTGGVEKAKAEKTVAAGLQVPRRLRDEHDGRTADENCDAENGSGNGMHAGDGPSEEIGVVIHDDD